MAATAMPMDRCASLHFRLGDYKEKQHYHPLATFAYYEKALAHLVERDGDFSRVMYCCEDADVASVDEMVRRLAQGQPQLEFCRLRHEEDWRELMGMSLCRHHIIATSSFSWWAAYLNPSRTKMVVYPKVWFGAAAGLDTRDLCPPDWTPL